MLELKINEDLKTAMKAKDALKVETLRMIKLAFSAVKNEKNAKEFTNERGFQILQKLAKTREETSLLYQKANREDLVKKELAESTIIKSYLPETIDENELNLIIATVIIDLEPTKKNIGIVMKTVTERALATGKLVDGRLIADKVKNFLV